MLWLNLFNIYIKFIKLALIWVQSHRFSSIRFEMTLNFRWKVQLLWWCKNCKNAFFKMNVFWNSYLRGAKKMKERNQSELDKIVFPELYNPFFRFNLSFFIAELHRFLWSLLAGYTLYKQIRNKAGYTAPRLQVGRGHIWGLETIWAGAVRSMRKNMK